MAPRADGRLPRAIEMDSRRLTRLLDAAHLAPTNERQEHGFIFQSAASALLGLTTPPSYIDPDDGFVRDEESGASVPVSFKNIRHHRPVELGSLAHSVERREGFRMYVAFWTGGRGDGLAIDHIHVMSMPPGYFRSLFPRDVEPFLAPAVFRGITNDRADDIRWRHRLAELREQWREALPPESPIRVRFKRDHGTQRRVQCAITPVGFDAMFELTYDETHTRELEELLDGGAMRT